MELGELTVHVREWPAADSPHRPVLMLHGWPQHSGMWSGVAAELAGERRLIAPDLRGFGRSSAPGRGYDAPTFARDQIALLDRLGVDRVDLIGHDWGGWTSFMLGLDHADRIGRILILNSPHPWAKPRLATLTQLPRSWYAAALATPGLGPALLRHTGLAHRMLGAEIAAQRRHDYAESFRAAERAAAVSALYRYYLRSTAGVATGRWRDRRLEPATYLLFGSADRMISPALVEQGLERHVNGGATVELVPGVGHFIADQRPALVADRARRHFGTTGPAA